MNRLLLILYVFIFPAMVLAQTVRVEALLDTNKMLIGDQVNLRFTVTKPVDATVTFPSIKDTITENLEILTYGMIDTLKKSGNQVTLKQDYMITSFDSAFYFIPSYPFVINGRDTIYSNPLSLAVFTLQVDTTKQAVYDIKKPYDAPWSLTEFLREYGWYILGGLILIGLVLFFIFYILPKLRRRPAPVIKIFEKPKEPAHFIALRELDKLKAEKLWQSNKIKEYHTKLTEIIRKYIENRFEIMAMEQTSDEILVMYSHMGTVDTKNYEILHQILKLADYVKFAKANPLPDENDLSMRNAYSFVEMTKIETDVNEKEIKEEGSANV
jgi:hypothetical protein